MNARRLIFRSLRVLLNLIQIVLVLVVLWQATRLIFQPDVQDILRQGDALFTTGRYHDAYTTYQMLTAQAPDLAKGFVRLGMVEAVRGDLLEADRSLAYALNLGVHDSEYDLVRLYQGYVFEAQGRHDQARQFWATIADHSPLFPLQRVLEADSLLAIGDYAGAEAIYRVTLSSNLPPEWRALVQMRIATLQAASDPVGALAKLNQPIADQATEILPAITPFGAPLLPTNGPNAQTLAAALRASPAQRPQLLGQLYLDSGMYGLAEAQFAIVAPNSVNALSAATYAAYTRWRAGDQAGGLRRLEALVASHPEEPRARALLALTYLAGRDTQRAQEQLATIRKMAPSAPDTYIAWGQWYTAQSDYIAAAAEYQRAFKSAPREQQGSYALMLARFYLDTSLHLCEEGRPAAETATRLLSNDASAWTVLAATYFHCDDPASARVAATTALRYDPTSVEATYYLGRALALLGDRAGAHIALVTVADRAPASPWRERAETQLSVLGL